MRAWRRGSPTSGDGRQAFEAEALTHLDGLYGTALRLTRDRASAQDLVQETFVKALRAAGQFEPGTNLRAWLFTILHNTFRNARRDRGRDPVDIDSEVVEEAPLEAVGEDPEALLVRASLGLELRAALDGLPEAYRQAVWLRDVEEFSYAEIAQVLGVPIGTVMSRIARGRRQLYARLTQQEPRRGPAVPAGGNET
jgi:RNA polymerase sigma-70 factor (ECF subfamily)